MAKFKITTMTPVERKTIEAVAFVIKEPFVIFMDGDIQVYAVALNRVAIIERLTA